MKSPSFEDPIKRDDPSTWGNDRWPQQQKLGNNIFKKNYKMILLIFSLNLY